jgi:hypothetical protein
LQRRVVRDESVIGMYRRNIMIDPHSPNTVHVLNEKNLKKGRNVTSL